MSDRFRIILLSSRSDHDALAIEAAKCVLGNVAGSEKRREFLQRDDHQRKTGM